MWRIALKTAIIFGFGGIVIGGAVGPAIFFLSVFLGWHMQKGDIVSIIITIAGLSALVGFVVVIFTWNKE